MMFKRVLLLVALLVGVLVVTGLMVGRSNPITVEPVSAYSFIEPSVPSSEDIRLSVMVTATVEVPEAIMVEGGSWQITRQMGHSAVLVCHQEALLMFDTGLGRDIDAQFENMPFLPRMMMSYEMIAPAVEQLDRELFCPGRPLQIMLSHLHWDHASAIEDFPDVPVWVPASELAGGRASGNENGYLISQFDDPAIDWRMLVFQETGYQNYRRNLDVFGDGRVVMVPMLGHTDGSMGMFVDMGEGQRFFFTGDISWSLDGFERPAHKSAMMRSMADGDIDGVEREIQRVHALMQHDPDLTVIPAHDYQAYPDGVIWPDWLGDGE